MDEKELAQKFVAYLSDMYDLYFEVGTTDIVGKSGSVVVSIEVKKHLNFKVIEQAHFNIRSSHYSYVAVPLSSALRNKFAFTICQQFGIGILAYDESNDCIAEKVKPKFNRGAYVQYAKKLTPDSMWKRTTPGAKSGETITAFSVTVEELEKYVRRHPRCEIRKALEVIEHHYGSISSARSCIVQYIDSGVIKKIRRDGNKLYLHSYERNKI